ncbi:hypothetical protein CDAR_603741 [Caerostris darwini]|uniref:Prokineticin domain-containing protein n=1 Tax=Caerostris darwini TaxID=1538125 RepID=A0AAV4T4W5_9ARAC|nr:hypothetical protein CDAR_603741 [Caerostris darwini]
MKWKFVGCVLVLCMVAAGAESCATENDCREDECCLTMRAKEPRGRCVKRGRERAVCSKEESKLFDNGGKFLRVCPCGSGLTCREAKKIQGIIGFERFSLMLFKCHKFNPQEKEKEVVEIEEFQGGKIIEEEIVDE